MPLRMTLRAEAASPWSLWAEGAALTGEIEGGELTGGVQDAVGSITRVSRRPTLLRYVLTFHDAELRALRFEGRRELSLRGLPAAFTVLPGELRTCTELALVGRALLRFDVRRDLARALFRLVTR